MDLRLAQAFLPHLDPEASLVFYREALGFEARDDVGSGAMRWVTIGRSGGSGMSLVLGPPISSRGVTEQESNTVRDLMAKGVYGRIGLSTPGLLRACARLEASGAGEVIQEPLMRAFGRRDCAFLDPAGNVVRIIEEREDRPAART